MRVQLSFTVDCPPDRAWALLRSPDAAALLYAPTLVMTPEAATPVRWRDGDVAIVRLRALGVVPLGRQLIAIRTRRRGATRILEDDGAPLEGALAVITSWRHRMAVTPTAAGGTRYRDRLDVGAGPLTPVVWLAMWGVWQWRGARMRRLLRDAGGMGGTAVTAPRR